MGRKKIIALAALAVVLCAAAGVFAYFNVPVRISGEADFPADKTISVRDTYGNSVYAAESAGRIAQYLSAIEGRRINNANQDSCGSLAAISVYCDDEITSSWLFFKDGVCSMRSEVSGSGNWHGYRLNDYEALYRYLGIYGDSEGDSEQETQTEDDHHILQDITVDMYVTEVHRSHKSVDGEVYFDDSTQEYVYQALDNDCVISDSEGNTVEFYDFASTVEQYTGEHQNTGVLCEVQYFGKLIKSVKIIN